MLFWIVLIVSLILPSVVDGAILKYKNRQSESIPWEDTAYFAEVELLMREDELPPKFGFRLMGTTFLSSISSVVFAYYFVWAIRVSLGLDTAKYFLFSVVSLVVFVYCSYRKGYWFLVIHYAKKELGMDVSKEERKLKRYAK